MKKIFADTFYWAALLNPKDQWHEAAKDAQRKLGRVRLVTTETVLIELLNFSFGIRGGNTSNGGCHRARYFSRLGY